MTHSDRLAAVLAALLVVSGVVGMRNEKELEAQEKLEAAQQAARQKRLQKAQNKKKKKAWLNF